MQTRIILTTQKGGTGKSTLCTNIAVAATEAGENVLLSTSTIRHNRRLGQAAHRARSDRRGDPQGGQRPPPGAARNRARHLQRDILDTPGEDSPSTHNAMTAANLCLVPIRPTSADGRANRVTVEALLRGGKRFAFLLNQCPTTPGSSRADEMAAGLINLGYLAKPLIGLARRLSGRLCGRAGDNRIRSNRQGGGGNAPTLGLD